MNSASLVIDGSHLSQNALKQSLDSGPSPPAVHPLAMTATQESFSSIMKGQYIKKIRHYQSSEQKDGGNSGSMKKKGNAVSVKEDLSKFLNFYNKSTYMGVAKTMGQKLQYKLYGRGNKLSMEELIPKDCFITPQTVRLNQLKERM